MAFFTTRDDENTDDITARLRDARQELELGQLTQEAFEALRTQLEAKLALFSIAPTRDENEDERLRDLEHLHSKGWISDEEYEQKRREITGQAAPEDIYTFDGHGPGDPDHVFDTAWMSKDQQLQQLETLYKAGLYTTEEYREEKKRIEGRG